MEPAYTALFKYSFVFLFTLIFSQAFANNTPHVPIFLEVQGRVADGSGKAITGASVQVKGTAIGTTTDDNGKFSLQADRGSILVVSHVGYQTREFPVTSEQPLLITLVNISGAMNEVIVIGYGTQKKSDLTGSISSIKGSELSELPTQRADQALQGRAAGVMVLNTDGSPGGGIKIRIRGINSINGDNNALVVIDGLQGGNLSTINPDDIASIEVLKDASATAIYGSQGANGVILITTKTGKSGKPVISYNYSIGRSELRRKLPLLDAADYARNINAVALSKNGNGITPQPIFTDSQIQAFETSGGTDWQDQIYRAATIQNHLLSLSGGTDRLSYRLSAGYLNQQGILLKSAYKRYSLRANVKAEVSSHVTFGLNWDGSKEITNSVLFGNATDWPNNPIGAAIRFSPTIPVFDSVGNYSRAALKYANPTLWNPVASTLEPFIENNTSKNNVNAYLEFLILKGLTLKIEAGTILSNFNNLNYFNTNTFIGLQSNGLGTVYNDRNEYYQNSNILTYDHTVNKHHFTLTGVAEQKFSKDYYAQTDGSDFLNQQTNVFSLSGANLKNNSSDYSERRIRSFMGRLNYVFNNRYLLTASYRADGSSVFGSNNKWGYFPSAALGWKLSEEGFIRNLNFFNDLKLRASWGITGNQAISPYGTLARVNSGVTYAYDGGDANNIGFQITSAANPDLKWESTTQSNIGADLAILGGRLAFTADWYKKTTKNLLLQRGLPSYTGLSSIIDNVGSIENKGLEMALSGDPVKGNMFKWNSAFQISFNKTKVLDLGQDERISFKSGGSGQGVNKAFMFLVKGEPYGQMYGWKYLGVWSTNQADEAKKYGQLPGDPHYYDKNGDGKINIKDTTLIGNAMPKYIFGWTNKFTYKNFDLSVLIQGVQGNDIFNVARVALDAPDGTSVRLLNRWSIKNQNSGIPAIIDDATRQAAALKTTVSFPSGTSNTLSRYIEDGSYVRLKNVMLSYNFSTALLKRVHFSNASVYFSAMNLVTLTKYTGYDPEVSSYNGNDAQLGSDYNNYPPSKTYELGLKFSF